MVSAFVDPGNAVIIPRPTYGLYAQVCAVAGAEVVRVDNTPSLALDLPAIAAAAVEHQAKLAWVCDPNNPTGLRLDQAEWDAFLDALPAGCIAVADEAYRDYIDPDRRIDRLADIRAGRRVIVLRTFSKIFGLAGLRLGYMIVAASLRAVDRLGARAVQRQPGGTVGRTVQFAPDRAAARASRAGEARPSPARRRVDR